MKLRTAFLAFFAIIPCAAYADAPYSIAVFPTLPDGSLSVARTISAGGVGGDITVGDPSQFNQVSTPVIWQESQIIRLPLPANSMGGVLSLNNFGAAAGWIRSINSFNPQPAIWSGGQLQQLDALGLAAGIANAVNDSGQVVGQAYDGETNQSQAMLWSGGQATALGNFGLALSINNAGQILVADATSSGVLTNGVLTRVTSADGNSLGSVAMNNAGHVTGETTIPGNAADSIGFLWKNGVASILPTFSDDVSTLVRGINDSDQVVGSGYGTLDGIHALLWQNGQVFDLNDLLPAGSGWTLDEAMGIADDGTIVGYGSFDGQVRAFELIPDSSGFSVSTSVPEPASALTLLLAFPLRRCKRSRQHLRHSGE